MAKDTQIYGSVELRDENAEYGTFTQSEKERQTMVGIQQSGSKSLKLRLQDPLVKARGFLVVIVDVSTFKHLIGR